MSDTIIVQLWGTTVGYLGYAPGQSTVATFEYDEQFIHSGIQISPITMAYPPRLHSFEKISTATFKGLPGICADSLPDSFGNQLIDLYFAQKGIPAAEITALDRLLYVGQRGMGALEYQPSRDFSANRQRDVILDIHTLAELSRILAEKKLHQENDLQQAEKLTDALKLIRVGSSAGGARSKALVARAPDGKFRDGTIERSAEYSQWLLKFDNSANADRDRADPKGMTRVEYIYSLIARACGITMPATDYLIDNEDFHFLVQRFDRVPRESKTVKLHYASWAALAHADRDSTGAYSYEQLILLARALGLGQDAITELFRRAVFNVIGRNQDDHTKNFGFLMDKSGVWKLSPAFDLTYAYDPAGRWTRVHQIRLSGKQDGFTREDLLKFGTFCNLDSRKSSVIIDTVDQAFETFKDLAQQWGVAPNLAETITTTLRTGL